MSRKLPTRRRFASSAHHASSIIHHSSAFTLIEMLVLLAVCALMFTLVLQFFIDGMRAFEMAQRRVEATRTVLALETFWQNVLSRTDPHAWDAAGARFEAGAVRIAHDGRRLVLEAGELERVFPLPIAMDVTFAVERYPDLADCAVMQLAWRADRLSSTSTNTVRLVACGEGGHD